jgi:hypothetical protein
MGRPNFSLFFDEDNLFPLDQFTTAATAKLQVGECIASFVNLSELMTNHRGGWPEGYSDPKQLVTPRIREGRSLIRMLFS